MGPPALASPVPPRDDRGVCGPPTTDGVVSVRTPVAPTYISRSTQIAARTLGGEMMIMSPLDSTFFTLNEVATTLWLAADGRTPLEDIVRRQLCAEFEVEFDVAWRDASEFVLQLSSHGILVVSDAPVGSAPAESEGGPQ